MPNHFHLVIETPQANLVAGMKWLLGTYTGRFTGGINSWATCSAGGINHWWWRAAAPGI